MEPEITCIRRRVVSYFHMQAQALDEFDRC